MSTTKKYWKSVAHLNEDPELMEQAQKEFQEDVPVDEFLSNSDLSTGSTSRRDFLKFLGFSVTAASLAACETPVNKAIPYVNKPEEITPGVANWYASTYADGMDYCSILVKTREGRPIMIEGNKESNVTKGGVNARVNSSVLSLYDATRLQGPKVGGADASWADLDKDVKSKLKAVAASGKTIAVLTNSIMSPSTENLIKEFGTRLGGSSEPTEEGAEGAEATASNVKHVTYDAISHSGMIEANEATFGKRMLPSYSFEKAKVIVSVGADFLNSWMSSIENTAGYGLTRRPDEKWMSKHFQFEANLSLTGSNADVRGAVKPSEYGAVVNALNNAIASKTGGTSVAKGTVTEDDQINDKIKVAATALLGAKGASLVVCGSNDKNIQMVVNNINQMLGNYENTISTSVESNIRKGVDGDVAELIASMKGGEVGAIIMMGGNPVYTMPASWGFAAALAKVKTKIAIGTRNDETAQASDYVAADHHYLESWNDANPKTGEYSLQQPVIKNLYATRQGAESLMAWSGIEGDYMTYMKGLWEKYGYPMVKGFASFGDYWAKNLHDGVGSAMVPAEALVFNGEGVSNAGSSSAKGNGEGIEVEFYAKTSIGEGTQLRNPWLQELPDPVTKVTWDNYITMHPTEMEGTYNTNLQQEKPAHTANITVNGVTVELPVVSSPGQKKGTVGVAIGYGQADMLVDGAMIGQNAYQMRAGKGNVAGHATATIEATGNTYPMGAAQTHHTMMGRKIVNETTFKTYKSKDRSEWNPVVLVADAYGNKQKPEDLDLWAKHDIAVGHRWGMSIDLNTCIGCGACSTACHAENNVPVVGKDEVRRNRDMHWMRIDRYFSSDNDPAPHKKIKAGIQDYLDMEVPQDYPQVTFQPVMCQHCNHASCETVCPVAATTHSNEGLNQMAYNRCVGTRYCANNCPYKVRRFNWFNYTNDSKFTGFNPSQEDMSRMVLNPDVVVRTRGVMEKCSMCVQRIQKGKLDAKKEGVALADGRIQTACSSACPTNAITFGDVNVKDTQVAKNADHDRAYNLLEEVGMQPNIWYMTKVRNAEAREFMKYGSAGSPLEAEEAHESTEEQHG